MFTKKILDTTAIDYIAPLSVTDVFSASGIINVDTSGGSGPNQATIEVFSRVPHDRNTIQGNYLSSKNKLKYTENLQDYTADSTVLQLGSTQGGWEKTDATGPLGSDWSYLVTNTKPANAYTTLKQQDYGTTDATVRFHDDNTMAASIYVKSLWNHNQIDFSDDIEEDALISFNPETANYYGNSWNIVGGTTHNKSARTLDDEVTPWGGSYLEILTNPTISQAALASGAFMILNYKDRSAFGTGNYQLDPWDENYRTVLTFYIKQPDDPAERLDTFQTNIYDNRVPQGGASIYWSWGQNEAPIDLVGGRTLIEDAGDGWYRFTQVVEGMINGNCKNGDPKALYWYLGNQGQQGGYTNVANHPHIVNKRLKIGGFQLETHLISTDTSGTTYVENKGININHHRHNALGYTNDLQDANWTKTQGDFTETSSIGTDMGNGETAYIFSGALDATYNGIINNNVQRFTATGEEKHTQSIYVKQYDNESVAASSCIVSIWNADKNEAKLIYAKFETYGGAPILYAANEVDSYGYEDAGQGWYRIWIETDGLKGLDVEGDILKSYFYMGNKGTGLDIRGKQMLFYGPQLEISLSGTPNLDPPRSYQEIRTDNFHDSSGIPQFRCSESMSIELNNADAVDFNSGQANTEASGGHFETTHVYDGTTDGKIADISSVGDGWYHLNFSVSGTVNANTSDGDRVPGSAFRGVISNRDPHQTQILAYGPQLGLTDSITDFYLGDYQKVFTTDTQNFDKHVTEFTSTIGTSTNDSGAIKLSPELYIRVSGNTMGSRIRVWLGHN